MKGEIKPFLISPDISIVDAMRRLDETAEKVLFVTDTENRLAGSLTDGDIRRWILSGGGLDEKVGTICNKKPLAVGKNFDLSEVRALMIGKRLECIPVVNRLGQLFDLLFWKEVLKDEQCKPNEQITIPVAIMAGGKGTRLDPFTRILPKPLIPIGDKPVIEVIIDSFREFGINKFFISVNHKAKIIKSYFEERDPEYVIEYINETSPLGTAGSLKALQGRIAGSFIVTNCDIIVNSNYAELVKFHHDNGNDLTLVASVKRYLIPYGICNVEAGGRLVNIEEKPEYSFLINTGLYVLDAGVLDFIPQNEFFHMTHLIEAAKNAGKIVGVFPISENAWIDTGEWEEYKKALDRIKI